MRDRLLALGAVVGLGIGISGAALLLVVVISRLTTGVWTPHPLAMGAAVMLLLLGASGGGGARLNKLDYATATQLAQEAVNQVGSPEEQVYRRRDLYRNTSYAMLLAALLMFAGIYYFG